MITSEQVMKALDAYYGIEHIGGARESLIEGMRPMSKVSGLSLTLMINQRTHKIYSM